MRLVAIERPSAPNAEGGFTLIELSVSLFILSIVTLGVTLFVTTAWTSANSIDFKAQEMSMARTIMANFEDSVFGAACVSSPSSTTSTTWANAAELASSCGVGLANVITSGTPDTVYYFAPSSRTTGEPTAFTEYEAMIGDSHSSGADTVSRFEIINMATGVAEFVGDDVTDLEFTYYDGSTVSCSANGTTSVFSDSSAGEFAIGAASNNVNAIGMKLTVQDNSSTSPVTIQTCVDLPNAT